MTWGFATCGFAGSDWDGIAAVAGVPFVLSADDFLALGALGAFAAFGVVSSSFDLDVLTKKFEENI